MPDIELFCVAHRPPPLTLPVGTQVIGVAGYGGGHLSDNSGELRISEKNPRFCELTALYWLVHNHTFRGTHAGICHYRRLWSDAQLIPAGCLYGDEYVVSMSRYPAQGFISSLEDLARQLVEDRSDALLPSAVSLANGVAQHYRLAHDLDDLALTFDLAIRKGLLDGAFARYFLTQKELYPYNMGVLPVEQFVTVWRAVLDVLLEIEDRIPPKGEIYQDRPLPMLRTAAYQNRVFGFLAERLYSALLMADLWKARPPWRGSTRAVMMVVE